MCLAGAADSKPAATEAEAANDEAKKPSSEEDSNIKAIEEQGDDQEGGKVSAPSANEQTAGGTAAKGEPASAVEPEAPIVQTEWTHSNSIFPPTLPRPLIKRIPMCLPNNFRPITQIKNSNNHTAL